MRIARTMPKHIVNTVKNKPVPPSTKVIMDKKTKEKNDRKKVKAELKELKRRHNND